VKSEKAYAIRSIGEKCSVPVARRVRITAAPAQKT
jgi:hypothetical protein